MRDYLRLEERLEVLEKKIEFYEYIFDNVKAGIYINTADGKQIWSNKYCEEYTGFTAKEITEYGLEKYMAENYHPDDTKVFEESVKHLSDVNIGHYLGIYRQKNAKGEWRKGIGIATITKRLDDGTPFEGLSCLIDITDKFDSDNQIESILKENTQLKNQLKFKNLTKRETELLKLVSQGLSTAEIAAFIGLSDHTVKTHRKNIMRKLKLGNVKDLVRFAVECGLH